MKKLKKLHTYLMSKLNFQDKTLLSLNVVLDEKEGKLTVKEKTVKLNRIEMKILLLLSQKMGSVVTLHKIYAMVEQESSRVNTRVFSHVSNLRNKIEAAGINSLNISFVTDGYRLEINT